MMIRTFLSAYLGAALILISGCATSQSPQSSAASLGSFKDAEDIVTLKIEGMACRNCANEVARELMEVPGVKGAAVDFDSATARVALDHPRNARNPGDAASPTPDRAATVEALRAAIEHWRAAHFAVKEDPNCLDPQRRQELQSNMTTPGTSTSESSGSRHRTAFLLIDAQVNQFDPSFPMPVLDAEKLLERLKDLVARARAANVPVIFVRNCGGAIDPDQKGTPGWQLHPQLQPLDGELVLDKTTCNTFASTDLDD